VRMKGRACPEAWAWWLLAKLSVPERVGLKVLPIPTKSRFIPRERPEALGEEQEPPRIHAGEVSVARVVLFGAFWLASVACEVDFRGWMRETFSLMSVI